MFTSNATRGKNRLSWQNPSHLYGNSKKVSAGDAGFTSKSIDSKKGITVFFRRFKQPTVHWGKIFLGKEYLKRYKYEDCYSGEGIGSRLGNPLPKPLTALKDGRTIMQQQIDNLTRHFDIDNINIVVGFLKDLIMKAFWHHVHLQPAVRSNQHVKSLLKALEKSCSEPVLYGWTEMLYLIRTSSRTYANDRSK